MNRKLLWWNASARAHLDLVGVQSACRPLSQQRQYVTPSRLNAFECTRGVGTLGSTHQVIGAYGKCFGEPREVTECQPAFPGLQPRQDHDYADV
jgi:hypothetical protein